MPAVNLSTGISMYYEESGAGEPVVLTYGAAGHHGAWEPQVRALSNQFRVITPDTRGTGKSDCFADRWSIELFARDLVALLDVLEIDSAHIGGMSMGSAISQEVAIRFPQRVRSLFLCNTWGRTDARLRLFWNHMLFCISQAERAIADEQRTWQDVLYRLNIALFFSPNAIENRMALVEDWWQKYSSGFRPETGKGHWEAILDHDALERLSQIKAPTFVLAGEEDYFTPYYPRQVHQRIERSRFELLRGAGSSHGLLWERADEANRLLAEFLVQNSA